MVQFRYSCDVGSIALQIGDARVQIGNGYGDGSFDVSVLETGESVDAGFDFTGTSICGPCKIVVLDYDCEGGKPLTSIELGADDMVMVYRNHGDVAIAINRSTKKT